MSDMRPTDHRAFNEWLARELRRPAPADPSRTARVMERVRAAPPPARRRWAVPAIGVVLAASLAGLVALRPLTLAAEAGVIAPRAAVATAGALRDTMAASLRDTIRGAVRGVVRDTAWLVQFAFVAPTAVRVAVAGDFNGWDPRATPLVRQGRDGAWTRGVPLVAGHHHYAFVVDDTQWVADPSRRVSGQAWSVRLVPDTAN